MKNNYRILLVLLVSVFVLSGCQSYADSYEDTGNTKGAQTDNNAISSEAAERLDDGEIFKGNENAEIILVELADFQCPACISYFPDIKKFTDEYKDKVKFVYLHYPLSYHEYAMEAALSMEAAAKQDKAWEMYDALYSLSNLSSEAITYSAKNLGLDMNKFDADKNSNELKSKIEEHRKKGESINLSGTPTFFLNGKQISFNPTYENLKKEVDSILNK